MFFVRKSIMCMLTIQVKIWIMVQFMSGFVLFSFSSDGLFSIIFVNVTEITAV